MKNELPGGWDAYKLNDLLVSHKAGTWGDESDVESGIPVIRSTNFAKDLKLSLENIAYRIVSSNDLEKKKLEFEDILLEKSGGGPSQPVGRVVLFDIKSDNTFVCGNFIQFLRVNKDLIVPKFLYYWLSDIHKKGATIPIQNKTTGIRNLRLKAYMEIKIPVPPLETQHKIVAILEKAEDTKKLRAQADELTKKFLQNVFLEMFGESSEKDWFMSNIEGVVHPSKGSVRTGPFGSQLLHGEFVEEGIAVLGIDNAVKNEFQWGKRRFISESKYNELKRYTVHPGDVLITIMGTCGRCAIVPDDIPIAINTKHLCCITLDQNKCLPIYLHGYFLQHPIARHYLSSKANGAIMDGLNMRIIKEMPILIAPIELQRKYAAIVQKLNETKQYQQQSSQEIDTLFNALMQKAFTGELVS